MARNPGEDIHDPDFVGGAGRAWDLSGLLYEKVTVEHTASLGGWLIETPFATPLFNYHIAGLTHLRDIPGTPKAIKGRTDATHEFAMYSLAPDEESKIDPTDATTLRNFVGQDMVEWLKFPTDERALSVVKFAIQKCVDGELIPASDFRHDWAQLFRSEE
jgi:hypothetical protein